MKTKVIILSLAAFLLLGASLYPKPYYPEGGNSKFCKTVLLQKQCLGKSVATPTDDPCATSATCYGLLVQ